MLYALKNRFVVSFLIISFSFFSCNEISNDAKPIHLVNDIPAINTDGWVNVVVEIPAGTLHKYEVDKVSGKTSIEQKNGKPRVIDYLPYPGNYGMIPQTLLSKENGGDGDPLDVLVLSPSVERETVLPCKIIGVLRLLDRGEQDDKLIAVSENSPLFYLNDIETLKKDYKDILTIIETWFSNYKGEGKMVSKGFEDREFAEKILELSMTEYKRQQ